MVGRVIRVRAMQRSPIVTLYEEALPNKTLPAIARCRMMLKTGRIMSEVEGMTYDVTRSLQPLISSFPISLSVSPYLQI